MAYVNVEVEGISARVIFSSHQGRTSVGQLHRFTTGILLEGSYTDPNAFLNVIEGRGAFDSQYVDLANYAKQEGIPLVSAEPTWAQSFRQAFDDISSKDNFLIRLFVRLQSSATSYLDKYEGEISPSDPHLRRANLLADWTIKTVPYMRTNGTYKNYMMAQRLVGFGNAQRLAGVERPILALVVGPSHGQVIEAIRMDPQERIARIFDHPATRMYVAHSKLDLGYLTAFDKQRQHWMRRSFVDPQLSE